MFYTMYLDGEYQLLLSFPTLCGFRLSVKRALLPRVDGSRFPMSILTAARMAKL
jgi:hypothetical protein